MPKVDNSRWDICKRIHKYRGYLKCRQKRLPGVALLFCILTFSSCTTPGFYTLASEVKGRIVLNGDPVIGALITYENNSHWYGKRDRVEVFSDEHGLFEIPSWTRASLITLLHQPVIDQTLEIYFEDSPYPGWRLSKLNYNRNGELGHPVRLYCELSAPLKTMPVDDVRTVTGICREDR